jgi:predicted PurR-regulated permease PerM
VTPTSIAPAWQRALIILTGTIVAVVVVTCLYWAQSVFVPVALAIFLAFLLAPLVSALQRRGLGRVLSVVLVVVLAGLMLGGVGYLVTSEITGLVTDLPSYTENVKEKVRSFRVESPLTDRLENMFRDISGELNSKTPPVPGKEKPASVVVQPESPAWLSPLPHVLGRVTESLGGLALSLVLVVFMLLKREDLRNRLIRLIAQGRIAVLTKAVDDAAKRVSRYLLMQFIINVGFGFCLGLGLFIMGFPHALLWGFLAALLRYIPYVGTWIFTTGLIVISIAIYPGWTEAILVVGLIAVLELLTYNVAEPYLFRQSTGVSEVALLVAAAFWAFLWGPIGLVLSSPLTVCLVVLGKYVPQLEFLDVLLGDEPVLSPEVTYYQRLLARDQDEATQLALTQAKATSPAQVFDEILIPSLISVRRDREREDATMADEQFVLRATHEIAEDLGEQQAEALEQTKDVAADPKVFTRISILGCPGDDEADVLALQMLREILDPTKFDMEILTSKTVSSEVVTQVEEKSPAVIIVGALPPGGLARTRYLCKRLRAKVPDAKILIGRWGLKENVKADEELLTDAGADQIATTLENTRKYLSAWRPVLSDQQSDTNDEQQFKEAVVSM